MSPAIGLSDAFGSFAQELYTRYLNEVQLSKELQQGGGDFGDGGHVPASMKCSSRKNCN